MDFIYAKVNVKIENGKIIYDIIKEQYVDVDADAITGKTNSSRVIKKAVESALSVSAIK